MKNIDFLLKIAIILRKKSKKYQFLHILLNMFLNICLLCLTWIHWIATVILQILSGKTWS